MSYLKVVADKFLFLIALPGSGLIPCQCCPLECLRETLEVTVRSSQQLVDTESSESSLSCPGLCRGCSHLCFMSSHECVLELRMAALLATTFPYAVYRLVWCVANVKALSSCLAWHASDEHVRGRCAMIGLSRWGVECMTSWNAFS